MRGWTTSLLVMVAVVAANLITLGQSNAPRITVYHGARLINGTGGAVIDNAAFVVENGRFTQVGRVDTVKAPAGAARVDLTGKTVIPAIIDSHVHLRDNREALVQDLQRRAYYGVSAAMSLGQDAGQLPFQIRAETIPNAARFFTAGRGITMPEPGRNTVPYWISTPEEGRKAVQELRGRGLSVFAVTVDRRAEGYVPRIFERGGYAIVGHLGRLPDALPAIYRQLVA